MALVIDLRCLARLSGTQSRSISPENFDGAKGGGAHAAEAPARTRKGKVVVDDGFVEYCPADIAGIASVSAFDGIPVVDRHSG
jgi:hypothetical protein